MAEQFHTVKTVAETLHCSRDLVRSMVKSGELFAVQIGNGTQRRRWLIPESALEAFARGEAPIKNA